MSIGGTAKGLFEQWQPWSSGADRCEICPFKIDVGLKIMQNMVDFQEEMSNLERIFRGEISMNMKILSVAPGVRLNVRLLEHMTVRRTGGRTTGCSSGRTLRWHSGMFVWMT